MADTKDYQTIIGEDAKFKGELEFDSSAKVLGKVEGSIQSKGRIISISESEIQLVEIIADGIGGYVERQAALDLTD